MVAMDKVQFWGETLRLIVELSATAAFALAGVIEAARKRLDAVGVCVVGFLTAFGGGTLRDLLLDQRLAPQQLFGIALIVSAVLVVESTKLRRASRA